MRQAVGHRIHSYYRINQTGADRIPEITASLRAMHPVVFGTLVSNDFMNVNGPSVVDIPKKGTAGGHAMLIVGYLNGFFKIKNSWGRNWRENGYCYMTPSYISWENTWDIWVPTSGVIFKRK
jgi:C1A family cysteine protease